VSPQTYYLGRSVAIKVSGLNCIDEVLRLCAVSFPERATVGAGRFNGKMSLCIRRRARFRTERLPGGYLLNLSRASQVTAQDYASLLRRGRLNPPRGIPDMANR
jgi:hypothetical protein